MRLIITADGKVHVERVGSQDAGELIVSQWHTLELQWLDSSGAPFLHASTPAIVIALKSDKAATALLASASSFTVPGNVGGYYVGDISMSTDQIDALEDKATAYLEVKWTVAGKLKRSDPLELLLVKPLTKDDDVVPTHNSNASLAAWLADHILGADGLTVTPDPELGNISIGSGNAVTVVGGFARFSYDGINYKWPVTRA